MKTTFKSAFLALVSAAFLFAGCGAFTQTPQEKEETANPENIITRRLIYRGFVAFLHLSCEPWNPDRLERRSNNHYRHTDSIRHTVYAGFRRRTHRREHRFVDIAQNVYCQTVENKRQR